MNTGKSCAIFRQINGEEYTLEEKGEAVRTVMDMATHNGIRKSEMMDVIRFMWNLIFDCASGPEGEE